MNAQSMKAPIFLALAIAIASGGCELGVQAGEPTPQPEPEVALLTGVVIVADVPTAASGVAMFGSPSYPTGEVLGLAADGFCRRGNHNIKLHNASKFAAVGTEVTLTAGTRRIPMPKVLGGAGEPPEYYRFSQSSPINENAVRVSWSGEAQKEISEAFEGELIHMPERPLLASSLLAVAGEPLHLTWGGTPGDFIVVSFGNESPSEDRTLTCSLQDTGSATIPADFLRQLDPSYTSVQVVRVKIRKMAYVQSGGRDYGVVGVGMRAAEAKFTFRPKRAFVTSAEYSGDLKAQINASTGLAAADMLCGLAAASARLGGTWKAWIADDGTDAIARMADVGPWYLVDGRTMVFESKARMPWPLVPLNVTETGAPVSSSWVWTGTQSDGTRQLGSNCEGWSSSNYYKWGGGGLTGSNDYAWTADYDHPCSSSARLYCVEQ